ncbi:MAG: rod shape-determining protein MreC [Planctomycetes bacterium]|nr:rod shape-determining protein MreC [Planctomycetota bacterium]MCC8115645.1 rod shape-determining protein MreC [Planctomycetota bacterium]
MRTPVLPPLILLVLAAALYLLPDGSLYAWRLYLRGAVARLYRPPDPRADASRDTFSDSRDLLILLHQREAQIADLRRRLAELDAARERVPDQAIVAARVVRLGPDNTLDTFTIDVGTRDGVLPGQAVVVGEAVAGIVARAEAEAALVLSLASTGCYLSARIGEPGGSVDRPRLLGAVRGIGAGDVAAVIFSSATAAKEGWIAMTSGLEGTVPEGLIIGTLAGSLVEGEESGTLEARLRPVVDLTSLDFVSVIARK